MATETTVNEARVKALADRKEKIASLKERIKSLGAAQRHNKNAHGERQRNFAAAFKEGGIVAAYATRGNYVDEDGQPSNRGWNKESSEQLLTVLHIVYNRLRNRPPHTKDDEAYICACGGARGDLRNVPKIYRDEALRYGLIGCASCPRWAEVRNPKFECDAGNCRENVPRFEFEGGEL